MSAAEAILSVEGLAKLFPAHGAGPLGRGRGHVRAVDGVTFTVRRGETLGVVGESGCGKSTLARCITRLTDPTAGRIVFDGRDITGLSRGALQQVRRELTMVFQDPFASLNPRKRIGFLVGESLLVHDIGTPAERRRRVGELLEMVGLHAGDAQRYPHEFSGGQRQRVGIARALAAAPRLIVCDEPVSALDVSIQAQILNLLRDLQRDLGLTLIFIAHDLSVVRHISDRVMVMYLGKVAEIAPAHDLYTDPRHPYTATLLAAVPVPDPTRRARRRSVVIEGEAPSPLTPPAGCRFHPRCPRALDGTCDVVEPEVVERGPGRVAACHNPLGAAVAAAGEPA